MPPPERVGRETHETSFSTRFIAPWLRGGRVTPPLRDSARPAEAYSLLSAHTEQQCNAFAAGGAIIEIAESVETVKTKAKRWWSERRALRTKVALLPTNPI